jgi:hypothetical protein
MPFEYENCASLATDTIFIKFVQFTPYPTLSPAPVALTASVDATTYKVTDLHAFVPVVLPFFFDSGPISLDIRRGFVSLDGGITMPNATVTGMMPVPEGNHVYDGPFPFGDGTSLESVAGALSLDMVLTDFKANLTLNVQQWVNNTWVWGSDFALAPPASFWPPTPAGAAPPGNYKLQFVLTDNVSLNQICCYIFQFAGANPVACTEYVSASPPLLLPTGWMTPVRVGITSSRGCTSGVCSIVSVTSNNPPGTDAVASGDAVITGALTVKLRAKGGRVYTVTLQCLDALGNLSNKSVSVFVL